MTVLKELLNEEKNSRDVLDVYVHANVYGGKYYEISVAKVPVLAKNESECVKIINAHKKEVIEYLSKRRVRSGESTKNLIPAKDPEKNVFFASKYTCKPSSMTTTGAKGVEVLTDSSFEFVKLSSGSVKESINQSIRT